MSTTNQTTRFLIALSVFVLFVTALFAFSAGQAEASFNVTYKYKGKTITVRVNTNRSKDKPDVQKAIRNLKAEANRLADRGARGQVTTKPSCGNTHKFNIGGTSIGGGGSKSKSKTPKTPKGGGGSGGGNGGGSSATCTHYNVSEWSSCTGYDEETGQGGTQTRGVTTSTGGCPGNNSPATSQVCNIPFDFSLAAPASGGGGGELVVGDSYDIEAVFVGEQQKVRSSSANISIASQFSSHPDLTDLELSVESVDPVLPDGREYFFSDAVLSPGEYATGTLFSVDVPRTDPGVYVIMVNVEGGGQVRTATVNLTVRVADPDFSEI